MKLRQKLSWAWNLNVFFTVIGGKFKFQVQDSFLEQKLEAQRSAWPKNKEIKKFTSSKWWAGGTISNIRGYLQIGLALQHHRMLLQFYILGINGFHGSGTWKPSFNIFKLVSTLRGVFTIEVGCEVSMQKSQISIFYLKTEFLLQKLFKGWNHTSVSANYHW